MIMLNEVNGMLAGTYRQQRIFPNALRFLANDLRVPLVCAGTDLARQVLLTDAQLDAPRWVEIVNALPRQQAKVA